MYSYLVFWEELNLQYGNTYIPCFQMLIPGTIQQEITELESIDMMLLRKVLSANSTTTSNADSWYNLTSKEITE